METTAGVEPAWTVLQTVASPLGHVAMKTLRVWAHSLS